MKAGDLVVATVDETQHHGVAIGETYRVTAVVERPYPVPSSRVLVRLVSVSGIPGVPTATCAGHLRPAP